MYNCRCSSLHLHKLQKHIYRLNLSRLSLLKPFGGKNNEDIDSWIFSMDLYFKVEQYIPQSQRAIRAALNLTADAAVWFRAKNSNLDALT